MQNISGLDGYNKSNTAINTGRGESLAKSVGLSKPDDKKENVLDQVGKSDRVTISPQAKRAMMRESIGLDPFWSVKKGDIEEIIGTDREVVMKKIELALDETGNSAGSEIDILDKGPDGIQVKGDMHDKGKLEDMLNSDKEFLFTYRRLSKNSKLIDRINAAPKSITSKNEELVSYLSDGNSVSDEAFEAIGREYENAKSNLNDDPISELIKNTSNSGPFTFKYKSAVVA